MGRLADCDLSVKIPRREAEERIARAQRRILLLRLISGGIFDRSGALGPPVCVVFEGWDASGKGGAIRTLVAPIDPRHVRVVGIAAPTFDEKRHHFLARFWPLLPGWGGMTVLDRSWYGRVLVERVEGFATAEQWQRAYDEINDMETTLVNEGMVLMKFWMHVSDGEQLARFQERDREPLKRWKLTAEDWRNREKRTEYEQAVGDMLERTDRPHAPWFVVPGEDKRTGRVIVLEQVISVVEAALRQRGLTIPELVDSP